MRSICAPLSTALLGWKITPYSSRSPSFSRITPEWLGQSSYPTIAVGETTTLFVAFRNVGAGAWVKGTASEARLGVNLDDRTFSELGMAVGWALPDRPAMQSEPYVGPGGTATFVFRVKGVKTGQYTLHLRPVIDGVTWMEDEGVFLVVTVR